MKSTAIVHDEPFQRKGNTRHCGLNISHVPCFGHVLYAPVSPTFPLIMNRMLKTFRPDILHFHVPNTSAFWALLISCARTIPWVVHWHADVVPSVIDRRMSVAYQIYSPVERFFLSRATSIIATSRAYLNSSRTLLEWKDKCHVIPLGLDKNRLKVPDNDSMIWAETLWKRQTGRILVIGRLTYYKGHDVLLDAASAIPDARILLVGDGDRDSYLRKRIQLTNLSENITLTGSLSEPHLHALLATCDCLCLPSIERTEAFGLVLLEAMRYGKPVVASNIPGSGIGWVVQDGVTGFLVNPGDPVILANTLRVVLGNQELRYRMGKNAEDRFGNVFQIDHIARQTLRLYRQMISSRENKGDFR